MYKYCFFLVLCLLYSTAIATAQNRKLYGVVLEKEETLSGATVILKSPSDSIVSATITDARGEFVIESVKKGTYTISASFLGLKTIVQNVKIVDNEFVRLVLNEHNSVSLNEILVEVDRSAIIQSTPEGSVFFLSSKSKKSKDIFNAFQEIPKLNIDITNRSITLSDGSLPLILINGAYREGASLSAIDPQNIESIEIIENAKAKHLVNGTSSVINIKLKKNSDQYKYVNIGTKQNPALIFGFSDINTTFSNKKYSIYLTGQHFYFHNNKSIQHNTQKTSATSKFLEANRKSNYSSYSFILGGDWSISDKDYFSYSLTYSDIPESYNINGVGKIENLEKDEILNYDFYKTYKKSFFLNTNNIYYKHTFSQKSHFESLFRLNFNGGKNKGIQSENSTDSRDYAYENDFNFKNERLAGSLDLDYNINISNGHYVNIGSRTEFQNNEIDQKTLKIPTFKYKEIVEYLYVDYSKKWNNKFSSLISVGFNFIDNKAGETPNNYTNIKYSINLKYAINTGNRISFNTNRYSIAPSVVLLNPYNTSTDSLLISQGNPLLKPYDIENVSIAYSIIKGTIFFEPQIYYKRVSSYISNKGYTNNGIYTQVPQNDGRFEQVGSGLSARYTIKDIGYINLYTQYNRLLFRKGIKDRNTVKANLNFNFYYKKTSFSGRFGLPIYEFDETLKSRSSSESELTFLWNINNQWDITFGSRYVTGRKIYEEWTYDQNYNSHYSNTFKSRNFIMLFGFRFNLKSNTKPKRQQNMIFQEDQGIELIKTK